MDIKEIQRVLQELSTVEQSEPEPADDRSTDDTPDEIVLQENEVQALVSEARNVMACTPNRITYIISPEPDPDNNRLCYRIACGTTNACKSSSKICRLENAGWCSDGHGGWLRRIKMLWQA